MPEAKDGPKKRGWGWYLLLIVPFIGVLFPEFFNRMAPSWGGLPYFYWYQLLWVFVSSLLTGIVYLATR
ncbi:MAG: DUF3311 domain-containing protein [Thermaerobacter sp.]|jgi:hypothetical protein|nr:DUF3311 domain-containing protein [Thermaerobacter sp.]